VTGPNRLARPQWNHESQEDLRQTDGAWLRSYQTES
jgi:hypothetical protein